MERRYEKTREAFGIALAEYGDKYKNLVVLEADISKSTRTEYFANKFPERFFQMGIAEQNETATAAGMAMSGKMSVVSTYAVFASMRACEQVRTFIAYPKLNVKIYASHGGLTPGNDGPTHQAFEDLGIMRTIPNMTVMMPTDAVMIKKALKAALDYFGPVYMRLTRDPVPVLYEASLDFKIGKAINYKAGTDLTIISIGDMLIYTVEAAQKLAEEGVSARIIDMPTLKPLDNGAVITAAKETGAIVTVEDHNILNGLGSAVSEVLGENYPVPIKRVGIKDTFAESGPYCKLLEKYGLSTVDIYNAAKEVLNRKSGGDNE
jgi:transketolase